MTVNKLIGNLKEKVEDLEGAGDLKSAMEKLEKKMGGNVFTRLFRKRGEFSITRTILILSWAVGLGLYVFGSLFSGSTIPVIHAVVPAFDSTAFLAVTGAASSLYFANHNVKLGQPKEDG